MPTGQPPESSGSARGFSLAELAIVLGLMAVMVSMAVGSLAALREDARALGAAHYLAACLVDARVAAIREGRVRGFYFDDARSNCTFQLVVDGNGNGLRAADVARGVDRLLEAAQEIDHEFPGVRFGVLRSVPPVDNEGAGVAGDSDPIRIGGSRFISFGPDGSGSSGTLYLAASGQRQLAVRVFGATGRVRVFEFVPARGTWEPR